MRRWGEMKSDDSLIIDRYHEMQRKKKSEQDVRCMADPQSVNEE